MAEFSWERLDGTSAASRLIQITFFEACLLEAECFLRLAIKPLEQGCCDTRWQGLVQVDAEGLVGFAWQAGEGW